MTVPDTRVIIVNFNAGATLLASVDAALASAGVSAVAIADNDSRDGSLREVEARFGADPRVEVHRNAENLGFARAVNRLARAASETYLLVLNPDCVLSRGAVAALVEALEQDPGAAVAGPWVTDESGSVQRGTWRSFPDPWRSLMTFTGLDRLSRGHARLEGVNRHGRGRPSGNVRVDAVNGACVLLRRSAAEAVGFYDEGYAMHCEDLDLMYRLQQAGGHSLLVPAASAIHRGGVSSASRPWWVHRQKHVGMQRYFRKFQAGDHSAPARWLVYAGIWGHFLLTLPVVAFRSIQRAG